jgi:23S rRNA pseudouridine1911/1915/1917 synthase
VSEVIPGALDGERVDRTVALVTGLTRAEVAALVEAGGVTLDGRVVRVRSRRVHAGQRLAVDRSLAAGPEPALEGDAGVAFKVVFADDDLIVIDKPAGLVVHPGAGHRGGTLVQGLLARYPDLGALSEAGAEERPGIVHRLDKGTSGLMVVARTAAARAALQAQLASRQMSREYSTVVIGALESDEGVIDAPLGRATRDPTRIAVHAGGRPARTRYGVVARFEQPVPTTLLTCRLETGRTHQVRVHLAAIRHPVLGDARYGGERATFLDGWRPLAPDRPFLHARALGLRHPVSGEAMSWVSELPDDLAAVLDRLA